MPVCEPSARTDTPGQPSRPARVRVVLVVGVAGAGKTTLGRALAARLDAPDGPWTFRDADDFHTPDALDRMARGHVLSDADRAPWLARLRGLVRAHLGAGPGLVLACSALRAAYRETLLAPDPRVATVWLDAPPDVLAARLAERVPRSANPVGPSLLPSQLATLEPPATDAALRLDATRPLGALATDAAAFVRGTCATGPAFPSPHPPRP